MPSLNFGERALKMRKHKGLNQKKLAALVGCSLSTISRVEGLEELDGLAAPFLIKLSKALEVSLSWLACGDGPDPIDGTQQGAALAGVVGDMEVSSLRVQTPMTWDAFRYVLMAEDGYPCKIGDVLLIDVMTTPAPGDDFAAMTKEGLLYARLVSVIGKTPVYQRFDSSATEMLDLSRVAWIGVVTGTLTGKRVTAVE